MIDILTEERYATILKILDEKKVEEDDEIYKYLKKNDIEIIISKKKLHTKIAIFDNKIALIGSLNWTKESFEENYESLLMSNNKEIIADIDNFFINFN